MRKYGIYKKMLLLDHNSIRSLTWMLKLFQSHLAFYEKLIFVADNSKIILESFKNSDQNSCLQGSPLYLHFFSYCQYFWCALRERT